jgi:competence protein ComEA
VPSLGVVSEVAPRQLIAYAILAVLIGVAGAHYARSAFGSHGDSRSASAELAAGLDTTAVTATDPGADAAPPDSTATTAGAIVDVAGAVHHPGVYRLSAGARVDDALRRAGGPTAHADLDPVNLAAPVADGQQIVVPRHGHGAVAVAPAGAASAPGAPPTPTAPAAPIDLNSATAEQLDTLDGVGPATAQKILEYRTQHGRFHSVEELLQVSGIGPKKLAAMRASVRV